MAALPCAALHVPLRIEQAQQAASRHPLMLHMLCTNCNPLADWACTSAVLLPAMNMPTLGCHAVSSDSHSQHQ